MLFKLVVIFSVFFPCLVSAQAIIVKKETSRVEGVIGEGFEAVIESPKDVVERSLEKFLKPVGKGRESDNMITIQEPVIGGTKYSKPLYATTWQNGKTTSAWIGIDPREWDEDTPVKKELEKLMQSFSIHFYRERIQTQIDESLRALQTVEKQQARLLNQNKDLLGKIESNKREKIQLEKSLVDNGIELQTLTQQLAQNKKAQDSVSLATDQIQKAVEMHKVRQENLGKQ